MQTDIMGISTKSDVKLCSLILKAHYNIFELGEYWLAGVEEVTEAQSVISKLQLSKMDKKSG